MTAVTEAPEVRATLARPELTRAPRGPRSATAVVALVATIAFTALALWAFAYALVLSGVAAASSQQQLHDRLREELGLATAPVEAPIARGAAIAVLRVPAAGIDDEVVVEGTGSAETAVGVGHARDTPLPGQPGTAVLVGRSLTAGAPLAAIGALRPGDRLTVTTGQGEFTYAVSAVRHAGDRVPPLAAGAGRLTLVTSTGASWRTGWVPSGLVYVDASLVGTPAPVGARSLVVLDDGERVWGSETAAWIPVVFWLQLLLLSLVGLVWLSMRVGGWHAWVIGIPVLAAVLWGLARTAHLLIPNVL
jgi:sortase A